MKDYKRLTVGAQLGNTPAGVIVANIVDFDGGDFELAPKIFDGGIVLVDPTRPSSYGFQIQGSPENLRKLGQALIKVAKDADKGDDPDTDGDA